MVSRLAVAHTTACGAPESTRAKVAGSGASPAGRAAQRVRGRAASPVHAPPPTATATTADALIYEDLIAANSEAFDSHRSSR